MRLTIVAFGFALLTMCPVSGVEKMTAHQNNAVLVAEGPGPDVPPIIIKKPSKVHDDASV